MSPPMSHRLEPLQQLADNREDEASRKLADAQRLVVEREQRLQELIAYRGDYERRVVCGTTQLLLNARQFIARLREAEAFQRQLVIKAQQELAAERARWLLRHQEADTLEMLAEVYRGRERRTEARRIQQQLDEQALRQYQMRAADSAC